MKLVILCLTLSCGAGASIHPDALVTPSDGRPSDATTIDRLTPSDVLASRDGSPDSFVYPAATCQVGVPCCGNTHLADRSRYVACCPPGVDCARLYGVREYCDCNVSWERSDLFCMVHDPRLGAPEPSNCQGK